MSLAPRERKTLAAIEKQLLESDPRLVALLTQWPARRTRMRLALKYPLGYRHRPRMLTRLLVVAAGVTAAIALVIVGVLTTQSGTSPGRGLQPASKVTPARAFPHAPFP